MESLSMDSAPRRFPIFRLLLLVLLGVGLCLLVYYGPDLLIQSEAPDTAPRLKVGGTSSANFMMDKWQSVYRKEKGVKVEYESTGSTKGMQEMIDKDLVIGFTHAPMSAKLKEDALTKGGPVVHVPVLICAVVPVYNLKEWKGKPPLKFTPDILADIFRGDITEWNDSRLARLNDDEAKGLKLPKKEIKVVHRKDSSGTTFVFVDYLFQASKTWPRNLKPSSEVEWPAGKNMIAADRNNGVAATVAQEDGAIGYVDLMHVGPNKLQQGAMLNQAKEYVQASPQTMSPAAREAVVHDDLTFDLINKPGATTYPICGAVWAVCYQNQPEANYQKAVDFLKWITHEGQNSAGARSYAPLPAELIGRVDEKINSIKLAP
jgi:phosphate ABC transporter phosphate-binding protein